MDFFARQDHARRRTGRLVVLYLLAVLATIFLVYFIPAFLWTMWGAVSTTEEQLPKGFWWHPTLFWVVFLSTILIVSTAALMKISQLRAEGGAGIALLMGGRELLPSVEGFFERRLRNVVEEMAIASGTSVPRVFVMDKERGINAFAAGYTASDAVVAVSLGCMEALTREELQGVVAHEFSHILNGDMALNINLMGGLYGLAAIGEIGRGIRSPGENGFLDLVDDPRDIGGVLLIMLLGLIIEGVGFSGMMFCRMIKSGVSRSRERLADAAAVQFTRNPLGLAGALNKIGRIDRHAHLRCVRAEQVSHMCFGQGTSSLFFATHPPLVERIRWLNPQFPGTFTRASLEDLRREVGLVEEIPKEALEEKKPDFVDLFTDPSRVAVAGAILDQATPRPASVQMDHPGALLDHVGKPMEGHRSRAKELLAAIPEKLREYLQDAHGARGVVFWMLLDPQKDARAVQLDLLASRLEPQMLDALNRARPVMEVLPPELRLPVLDLALPVLRTLSAEQYQDFCGIMDDLIQLDERLDLREFVLRMLLRHHLDPEFGVRPRKPYVNYYALRGLSGETSCVLSVLARYGHAGPKQAREAFDAAVQSLKATKGDYLWMEPAETHWELLSQALEKLQTSSFRVKRWFLGASLVCITHDQKMTLEEVELFRVIADVLDCPVPPWVAPDFVQGTGNPL